MDSVSWVVWVLVLAAAEVAEASTFLCCAKLSKPKQPTTSKIVKLALVNPYITGKLRISAFQLLHVFLSESKYSLTYRFSPET